MMKKRILAGVLACTTLVSVTGCGASSSASTSTEESTTSQSTSSSTTAEETSAVYPLNDVTLTINMDTDPYDCLLYTSDAADD